jgi:hypothetical protein
MVSFNESGHSAPKSAGVHESWIIKTLSDLSAFRANGWLFKMGSGASLSSSYQEATLIDRLQSICDCENMISKSGLRDDPALTHLREVSPSEAERVIRRFTDSSEFSKLKCLLLPVRSQKDLGKETLGSTENILQGMAEGEIRIISI